MTSRKARYAVGMAVSLIIAAPSNALIVYDPANHAQNVLQAARALQQINQQVQSLQNQLTMVKNMARNLDHIDVSSLGAISSQLIELQQLIAKGQGIASGSIEQHLDSLFPASKVATSAQGAAQAGARLQAQMASFQDSLRAQARILAEINRDQQTLTTVAAASDRADGNLSVTQATNQLLALSSKQQAELQSMLAVHFQADALASADQLQRRKDGQDALKRFLGTGHAYTPQ